jgi:homopolymeric O-antigen transport system ATP-binding protein
MSDIAVRVENLSKQYRIGGPRASYKTLRESIAGAAMSPFRALRNSRSASHGDETIWALKDVSFEVKRGEVVGIIGRNGAGKSTLLKILSRITKPTEGRAVVSGRVGSLLEVGTGFHPELTGRENIYLNGAILGMKRTEIARKFDEIVDFAEIEKFLDTPVKHYSSGMYVRLGFAVASYLEAEVLLVDEVLAVGDAAFQRKCLRRIADLRRQGRTVLIVSHDLNSVRGVCSRAAWIKSGGLDRIGETEEVTSQYKDYLVSQRRLPEQPEVAKLERVDEQSPLGEAGARITRVELLDRFGEPRNAFEMGETMRVAVHYRSDHLITKPVFGVGIERTDGLQCYGCTTDLDAIEVPAILGEGIFELEYESVNLLSGTFRITTGLWDKEGNIQLDSFLDSAFFEVRSSRTDHGAFFLPHRWHLPSAARDPQEA